MSTHRAYPCYVCGRRAPECYHLLICDACDDARRTRQQTSATDDSRVTVTVRVIAAYDTATGQPLVRLIMQDALDLDQEHEWHITPAQARDLALSLLQGAKAAEDYSVAGQRSAGHAGPCAAEGEESHGHAG